MSVISPLKLPVPQKARVPYRIAVDQYQQMVQAGILGKYDRCLLIEGVLVERIVRNPPHNNSLLKTDRRSTGQVPEEWLVRKQSALLLDDSVPEPDVVVARGDESTFAHRHPGPADVGLLCEIADSSLRIDREMAGIYARNNMPVYWIVNLNDGIVEVYTQPSGPTPTPSYADRHDYARGDSVPLVLDGNAIAMIPVAELLS